MRINLQVLARVLGALVLMATPIAAMAQPAGLEQSNLPIIPVTQDVRGAEHIEIHAAIFGGGVLIIQSRDSTSHSNSYTVSGAVTANANRWFGIEGDLAWAVGHSRAHELFGVVPPGPYAPNMLLYTGNLVYNPFRSNRPFVPYLSAGVGGLTTFGLSKGSTFGVPGDTTFLVATGGAGVRWFPIRHWGVRGDYRMLRIRNDAREPAVEASDVRSAHRIYGALVLTF
jgi:opacity protein-like surface antigen